MSDLKPTLLLVLWIFGACSGNDTSDAGPAVCPATYTVGDSCQSEGLRCPYATSMCGLKCTCSNNIWVCRTQWCECSCSCGRILKSSCELLECSPKAANKCPSAASKHCEVICWDAGTVDFKSVDIGTKDAGTDGTRDSARDLISDTKPDISLDISKDQAQDQASDQTQDTASDLAPDTTKDLAPDTAKDLAPDTSKDLALDTAKDLPQDTSKGDLTKDQTPDAPAAKDQTMDAPLDAVLDAPKDAGSIPNS